MKEYFEKRLRIPAAARLLKSERGFFLVETLVSIALLSIVASGFLSALSTGSRALSIANGRETAANLAESQMEYVKSLAYQATSLAAASSVGATTLPAPLASLQAGP